MSHTIDGVPINQNCAPGVIGWPWDVGSIRYASTNLTNDTNINFDVKNLIDNMNSFIDVARNSLIYNNSNDLSNNNINNNTSITSIDSIDKTSRESTTNNIKLTNLAADTSTSIDGIALDSACTDSSYRTSDAIAQNIQITPITTNYTGSEIVLG